MLKVREIFLAKINSVHYSRGQRYNIGAVQYVIERRFGSFNRKSQHYAGKKRSCFEDYISTDIFQQP